MESSLSLSHFGRGIDETGSFHHIPIKDTARLTEIFRRRVLKLFVDRGLLERRFALKILSWKHSGFSVDAFVRIPASSKKARVVYYGVSPATEKLAGIRAPVLGLYGGDDNRVNSTIPAAEKEMKRLGKRYEYEIYEGAGHAFLRNQSGKDGANLKAAKMAWPRMVSFFKEKLRA